MPAIALEACGGLIGHWIWLSLIHSLWIGLLAAAVAALITQSAPRVSHQARHATLAAAMLVAALGPVAMTAWHHLGPAREDGSAARGIGRDFLVRTGRASPARLGRAGASAGDDRAAVASPSAPLALAGRAATWFVGTVARTRPALLVLWSLTVVVLVAILIFGMLGLGRLRRGAVPAGEPIQRRARRLARLLRLRPIPNILTHPRLAEPFLGGLVRPVVLLPARWADSASPRAMDAILAHELAHACRKDQAVNLAQRLAEVALFFHPAVHWLSRSLRRERELCADALAVRLTGDPLALAESLQSVARLRLESRRIPAAGTSLGGPSVSLLPRIQELIGMTPPHPRFSAWPFAALPAAGFLALVAAAADGVDGRPTARAATEGDRPPVKVAIPLETPQHTAFLEPLDVEGDPRFTPVNGKLAVDDDRQICFEVRYITRNAGSWREPLGDRLKLIKKTGVVTAWTLDDRALRELITTAQDTATNILRAPKVTTFNGARATIVNKTKVHYVADVETVEGGNRPVWHPVIKALNLGSRLDMTGTIEPAGTRLAIRLSDSWLTDMQTKSRRQKIGPHVHDATFHVPTVVERTCDLDCLVSDGTHVLISEGPTVEHCKPTGLAGLANNLFAAVGLPEPIKSVPSERLVVITPRRIILEPEEQPVRSASRASGETRVH